MKMETKVDVHTVHPCPPSEKQGRADPPKGPYGSWCTPDATPGHTRTPSSELTKSVKNDDIKQTEAKGRLLIPQKVRLFASTPPSRYKFRGDNKESGTELRHRKKSSSDSDTIQEFSPEENTSIPNIETPQSPVPTSPVREKKIKGFNLPLWCDPFLPIDPQGRTYISWLLLVTFCYSYNAWCIALRVTFPYQTPENTPLWMTADYLCDLVYLLDVAFVKPRLMFLQEGFWVDDPVETRKNYRRKLQFKFDVISLLPLDLLYFYFGPQKVILRVPRVLKLQTFWEFHRAMDRVLSSPYVVRIGKMLFYIFYLIHLNACAYYAMSDYIGLGSNGWVYDNQGNAYIRCFYFATKTATSIGKNPKPESTVEYLFMTFAWLMGVFVFALLIGQIRDIIATATRARAEYRKTIDGCTQYMRRVNMPKSLQKRVTSWFNYTWSQQRCFDDSQILNFLPYNMKRDVALAVHMSTLSKVQLFRDCSSSLLRDLVLQLRPVSFLPGDVVVRGGEVGHHMYIIKAGECTVMSPDETEILATLKEGSVFGEISLLGIEGLRRRTATVRSRGYSTLFALSRSDLEAALKHHKEAAQILRLRADQIIKENAARQTKQRIVYEEARKSASLSINDDNCTLRRRRLSSTSSNSGDKRRPISVQSQARKRLSVVSEDNADLAMNRKKEPDTPQSDPGEAKKYRDEAAGHLKVGNYERALTAYNKVACTNWKRILMILSGKWNDTNVLAIPASLAHTPGLFKNMSTVAKAERDYMLENYHKMIIVRNPFERLLSAYRNKLEGDTQSAKYFQDRVGRRIIKAFRENPSNESLEHGHDVTFKEFVLFLTNKSEELADVVNNEHWQPISNLCHPCLIKYTLVGKYETLLDDSQLALHTINASSSIQFPHLDHTSGTAEKLHRYFSELDLPLIRKLYKLYKHDYRIFNYDLDNIVGFDLG